MVNKIWIPGWEKILLPLRGKNYQYVVNPKGCLHTTEGTSIEGAIAAYKPYPPHGIYDWRNRRGVQHIGLDLASYSAMDGNDDDFMVQIELVGFAHDTRNWPDQAYRNIAQDVIAPLADAFGIPGVGIWERWLDDTDGVTIASPSSPIRITSTELRDFSGWLGHQHLPAPDEHWDPGALDIKRLIKYAYEGDDVALTEDQASALEMIPDIHHKITAGFVPSWDGRPKPVTEPDDMRGDLMNTRMQLQQVMDRLASMTLLIKGGGVTIDYEKMAAANKAAGIGGITIDELKTFVENLEVALTPGTE